VALITMLKKNSEGTVIGKLLGNKYFEQYENSEMHLVFVSEK
jgi:hypothetical protein